MFKKKSFRQKFWNSAELGGRAPWPPHYGPGQIQIQARSTRVDLPAILEAKSMANIDITGSVTRMSKRLISDNA